MSSVPSSPFISLIQPLVSGRIFSAPGVLIGAEFLLLVAKYIFKLDSVPLLDGPNNQMFQIPLNELQALLKTIDSRQYSNLSMPGDTKLQNGFIPGTPTELPPEVPFIISLYISADYSNQHYTPSLWILIPILSFPGLRGALPLIILSLIVIIFVRSVVPPETTGSKPFPRPTMRTKSSLNLGTEELLRILQRFGRYFD